MRGREAYDAIGRIGSLTEIARDGDIAIYRFR
jgi:hypothetical protein